MATQRWLPIAPDDWTVVHIPFEKVTTPTLDWLETDEVPGLWCWFPLSIDDPYSRFAFSEGIAAMTFKLRFG